MRHLVKPMMFKHALIKVSHFNEQTLGRWAKAPETQDA